MLAISVKSTLVINGVTDVSVKLPIHLLDCFLKKLPFCRSSYTSLLTFPAFHVTTSSCPSTQRQYVISVSTNKMETCYHFIHLEVKYVLPVLSQLSEKSMRTLVVSLSSQNHKRSRVLCQVVFDSV